MQLFNNYIDWRKNISKIEYYGIHASYSNKLTTFDELKSSAYDTFDVVPDSKLKRKLLLNDIQFQQSPETFWYEAEFDYDMKCMPEIMPRFSVHHNSISKRKIENYTVGYRLSKMNHELLFKLSNISGLTLMMLYNPKYNSWSNNDRPDSYKYKKGLKQYFDERFQIHRIDISDRPGRTAYIGNTTWFGGHEYWFGPGIYEYIPKNHILEFEHADNVQELPNDLVYIKLMDMHEYWTREGQGRLFDLRDHLQIDRLEKEYLSSIQ